jgi:hypothetical protein
MMNFAAPHLRPPRLCLGTGARAVGLGLGLGVRLAGDIADGVLLLRKALAVLVLRVRQGGDVQVRRDLCDREPERGIRLPLAITLCHRVCGGDF